MVSIYSVWLRFFLCAAIIFFAGKRVTRYADAIAEKTGLTRLWVGVILVAVATSLPELFTGVGSIVFLNAPDLTIGNVFGANSYNILNIIILDILNGKTPILSMISSGQLLTAAFSLIPLILAAAGIALSVKGIHLFSVGNVGIFSIAIVISYFVLTKIIYNYEKKNQKPEHAEQEEEPKYGAISLKRAYIGYAVAAAALVASGVWLAYIGNEISDIMRLDKSFIGTLFVGFVTTIPEITVSVAALLMGAREIAIANMLGSNLFNMTIIFVDDVLYRKAPVLQAVSPNHVFTSFVVMAMTAVVILAIATRYGKKIFNISWYVPLILFLFLLGAYVNFRGI
ncbi:MAG: sodium:calcium antiporter [Candidatus Omnitrophica bacterium]|nr:sodium:calcium antiporter [Candidatus Omnitrophota bacterium]